MYDALLIRAQCYSRVYKLDDGMILRTLQYPAGTPLAGQWHATGRYENIAALEAVGRTETDAIVGVLVQLTCTKGSN